MKNSMRSKMSKKKKTAIIICSIVGVLLVLFLVGYLIINNYLNKIKYDSGKQSIASSIAEERDGTGPDSPQSTIDDLNSKVKQNMKDNSTPLMYDKDVYNVLLIGSDTRVKGGTGRSDSMILFSINKKTSKIIETSILRDIYVAIPGVSLPNRINAAYAYGGPDLLLKTIQQNFKVKVDKYVSVDFYSFMDLVDEVGGIDIDISDAEIKVANNYIKGINQLKKLPENDGLFTKSGNQHVTGKQAISYARIRYVGNGDFGRTDRQRLVLNQILSKIKDLNLTQINSLLNTILPEITTNVEKGEIFSLILSMPQYSKYEFVSWHLPTENAYTDVRIRGMSVLDIDFDKAIEEINSKIYT